MTDVGGQGRQGHARQAVPARAQTFGMLLFLAGLAVLFASSMLLYAIVRFQASDDLPLGGFRDAMGDWKLFASTAVVLLASLTIHRAMANVRRERQGRFRGWLWATNVLAVLFLVIQAPAMAGLLGLDPGAGDAREAAMVGPRPTRVYSFLFVLVLLHALHVVGGVVYLAVVTIKAYRGHYDHEHSVGVRHAALYWHFLDVVWLTMFGTFVLLG